MSNPAIVAIGAALAGLGSTIVREMNFANVQVGNELELTRDELLALKTVVRSTKEWVPNISLPAGDNTVLLQTELYVSRAFSQEEKTRNKNYVSFVQMNFQFTNSQRNEAGEQASHALVMEVHFVPCNGRFGLFSITDNKPVNGMKSHKPEELKFVTPEELRAAMTMLSNMALKQFKALPTTTNKKEENHDVPTEPAV
jgi:hypothetical protein